MATALASLLPAPKFAESTIDEPALVTRGQQLSLVPKSTIPPYGQRKGWRPQNDADFGDGGAYPECHVAQYPQQIGKKLTTSGSTLALQVDSEGKVRFDVIAQQGHRDGRRVQSQFKDLVPLAHRTDVSEHELAMERPSEEEVQSTTERTKAAFEKLVNSKIKAANPKHVPDTTQKESYIRYTPGGPGADGSQQRIIKMVDVVQDPLEPPKFKGKKIPRGPPSPPAPILRSPPRKTTAEDQKEWMIPPCVSNWKNNKGYTIPLDKRLAADGRGLQDTVINDGFATLSESLYVADRHARDDVRARAQMQQRIAQKEKESKEEGLRMLAQRAREKPGQRAAGAGAAPALAGSGGGGAMAAALAGYGSGSEEGSDEGEADEEDDDGARERDELRRERRRDREREMRMSNMGTEQRARVLAKAQNRDISEKIALGLAKPTLSKESMLDSRLFNQEQLSSGFADDDAYNLYDRPLFQGSSAAAAIYKPHAGNDDDEAFGGGNEEGIRRALGNDRFGIGVAGKGFAGAELQEVREGPVQFERDTAVAADPFGVSAFLDEAKRGVKRGLDTSGGPDAKRAR